MKLLFALTPALHANKGGVQHTTVKLGQFFCSKAIEVYYYSFTATGHQDVVHGILYHSELEGNTSNPKNITHFSSLIRELKPDVVINQMPYDHHLRGALKQLKGDFDFYLIACIRNSMFSFLQNYREIVSRMLRLPGRLHFPALSAFSPFIKGYHKTKHASVLRSMLDIHDRLVLLTEANRKEVYFFVKDYSQDKISVIPNSIPSAETTIPNKLNILLFVGRMNVNQKRVDLLLPVWRKLKDVLPDWEFHIVGSGIEEEKLRRESAASKMERIYFYGRQIPVPFYQKSKIFCMTSAFEGFPNVVLEAQSFGCVPVAFNSYGAISEIVEDKKNAFLVDPFDIEKMSSAILKIAQDDSLRQKMSVDCLLNASKFLTERVGLLWLNLFREQGINC